MSDTEDMGCCSCFGFLRKLCKSICFRDAEHPYLLDPDFDYDNPDTVPEFLRHRPNNAEQISLSRAQTGFVCREIPVKETDKVIYSRDENGNKMVNEYVHQYKIGEGSYARVVLYRSLNDGKLYAIKVFHKSYMKKVHVAPSETAMTDVRREVVIMKMLNHPNIVNLIEVIDDPDIDKFYMVLEYVERKMDYSGGLGEVTCRKYFRDIVSGLMYLHSHKIVHGDIKPDNLLVTSNGNVKIGDFGVSQLYEKDDMLRRSPGTPVFTAPECCQGSSYHGKAADTWAVGVTLYCMVFDRFPFLGDTLQETYDKIVDNPVQIPGDTNPQLADLIDRLLTKDPKVRITLNAVTEHPWVVGDEGPIPEYLCHCGYGRSFESRVLQKSCAHLANGCSVDKTYCDC